MALLGGTLFGVAGGLIAQQIYPISDLQPFLQNTELQSLYPGAALLIQAMASLGTFVIPSILFGILLAKPRLDDYFTLKIKPALLPLIILLFLGFLVNPVADLAYELNQLLQIPESWGNLAHWINSQNERVTEDYSALLNFSGFGQFSLAMVTMALIPAIGEELFFRGILQRIIQKQLKRNHAGIWITALIFGLIHFQISLLLPRLILGAFIGYIFWWSGQLWYAIAAHFINNSLALTISYYYPNLSSVDKSGISTNWIFLVIGSILFIVFLHLFYTFVTHSKIWYGKRLG